MDFLTRILGGAYTPRKQAARGSASDQNRFTKFKNVIGNIQQILSTTKRDLAREDAVLYDLQQLFERLVENLRQENRAPNPHLCVQFAATHQIYTIVNRAAAVSFHEGCIRAAIGLMSALVDSEEENFMTSDAFAKSLMRLVSRVIDGGSILLSIETETQIMELLFTITAKIRLQPVILRHWFSPSRTLQAFDNDEKQGVRRMASKDDFQLAYILVDRVYHEGRIGDFSRTGILYIFEASSNIELADWIIASSDIPTLLASGLGALYSQLSRELNILHPDASIPAILAMSDYNNAQARFSAESAFSEKHVSHMTTFLQYLMFWQDILAHTKSDHVKETLLDHFRILFLQQLLYPSVLQSSDTDGSSVAILTYLKAVIEALENTDLIANILSYLLAVEKDDDDDAESLKSETSAQLTSSLLLERRRESLIALAKLKDPNEIVDPDLFNLGDLIQNSLDSSNSQTVFSALELTTVLFERQSRLMIGTMLKVEAATPDRQLRSFGSLQLELREYMKLATRIHRSQLDRALEMLSLDASNSIQNQLSSEEHSGRNRSAQGKQLINSFFLASDPSSVTEKLFMHLKAFWTNSIEVNVALTQSLLALATCIKIRPEPWLGMAAKETSEAERTPEAKRPWQSYLSADEMFALESVNSASRLPAWPTVSPVLLYSILNGLVRQLDDIRPCVPGLNNLISARKIMLQSHSLDITVDGPFSRVASPVPAVSTASIPLRTGPAEQSTSATSPRSHSPSVEDQSLQPTTSSADQDPTESQNPVTQPRSKASLARLNTHTRQTMIASDLLDSPSTTDILIQKIDFTRPRKGSIDETHSTSQHSASLNHALTNIIVLQDFILALVAVLQVRASLLGEAEIQVAR